MNTFLSSLVPAWGGALLSFLWQGLLIGIVTAFLLGLSRQARPQVRYMIACVALALCFALPVFSVWRELSAGTINNAGVTALQRVSNAGDGISAAISVDAVSDALTGWMSWVVIAWSLGCAFFSLRMAMGLSWIANARRHSRASTDDKMQSKLNLLAIQFDVPRPIQLLVCNDIDSPVTAGWWKPIVLVPASLASRMPPDYIEALLAHELAHIKRHDYLVNLIQSFIEAVLFFHPVVWWLSKQIRIERENIADDLAAEVLGEPRRLAIALAALDEFQLAGPLLAPAAHGGKLMSRIQRLIKPTEHVLNWKMSAVLIGLTLACLTVYAHEKSPGNSTSVNLLNLAGVAAAAKTGEAAEKTSEAKKASQAAAGEAAEAATDASDAAEAAQGEAVEAAHDAAEAAEAAEGEAVEAADDAAEAVEAAEGEAAEAADAAQDAEESDDVSINNVPRHESFALVTAAKDAIILSGSTHDIDAIQKARKTVPGDFLWFRRDGKPYVVQDPALLANAKAAWRDSEKLSARMDALSARMEVHSKAMEAIGARMEAVSKGGDGHDAPMEKAGRQMEVLSKQLEKNAEQMTGLHEKMMLAKTDSQRQALTRDIKVQEAKMSALQLQMEKVGEAMSEHGAQLEKSLKPLDALSREMETASKPMNELGQQMSVLGRQQEALTREADKKVLDIINASLKNGQARPVANFAPR